MLVAVALRVDRWDGSPALQTVLPVGEPVGVVQVDGEARVRVQLSAHRRVVPDPGQTGTEQARRVVWAAATVADHLGKRDRRDVARGEAVKRLALRLDGVGPRPLLPVHSPPLVLALAVVRAIPVPTVVLVER